MEKRYEVSQGTPKPERVMNPVDPVWSLTGEPN
jgi:hypothetical protein